MARQNLENEELGGVIRAKINDNFSELYGNAGLVTSVEPTISSDFTRNEHKLYEQYGLEPKTITQMYDVVRASTATYVDATGKIRTAGVNEPRIDYSSGQGRLLVEEARTNLLTWSEDFSNSAWVKTNTTVTSASTVNIYGNIETVDLVNFPATSAINQSVGITSGTGYYSFSVFIKPNTSNGAGMVTRLLGGITTLTYNLSFNADTESLTTNNPYTSYGFEKIGNGWYRVFGVMQDNGSGNNTAVIQLSRAPDGSTTNNYFVMGAQLEAASTPSSYIPTEASAVTRAADSVSRVLGDEFNASEFTFITEFVPRLSVGAVYYCIDSNNANSRLFLWVNPNSTELLRLGLRLENTVAIEDVVLGALNLDTKTKIGILVSDNSSTIKIFRDGVLVDTRTYSGTTVGNLTRLSFTGRSGGLFPNAEYGKSQIYPKVLSDQECQELTKI